MSLHLRGTTTRLSYRSRVAFRRLRVLDDEEWSRGLGWVVLVLAAVQTVGATIMLASGNDPWGFALVGGLCTALIAIPFLVTPTSIFSLWGPVALVVTLGTGIRGLAMATGYPDPVVVQDKFVRGNSFWDLVWPAVVCVLSVALIVSGYVVARRRRPIRRWPAITSASGWALPREVLTPRRCAAVVGGFALTGALATFLYLHAVGGLGARINDRRTVYESGGAYQSYGHWEFLARCGVVALIVYLAWALLRSKRLRLLDWGILLVLFVNAFAINVITTTRTDVPYVTLGALLVVHVVRGRIGLPVIAATGLLVVIGIGLLSGLRGGAPVTSIADGATSGLSSAVLNRNGYDLSKTLVIIDAVPGQLDHAYGGTVARYVLAPVPRALWPGKPAISEGVTIGREVYDLERTGIPPGITAELVWNVGRVLAVVLSFFVGLGLGLVESVAMRWPRDSITALAVRALVVLPLGKAVMGVSLGQATSSSLQTLALLSPLLLAALLWGRPRPARAARGT